MLALLSLVCLPNDPAVVDALENVRAGAGHRYAARDDKGNGLDCLKIVEVGKGNYLGVYHSQKEGVFTLKLARSSDLLNWKHVRDLDVHAHQGTLSGGRGPVMLAYEKDGPNGNWIRLRRYVSASALEGGRSYQEYDLPRKLSKYAEGTPSFQGLGFGAETCGTLRFHYLTDAGVDRQASGYFALSGNSLKQWSPSAEKNMNRHADLLGIKGNFGDRDTFHARYKGAYELIEGQLTKNDWASWRVFLRSTSSKDVPAMFNPEAPLEIKQLAIKTHGGSIAFANPTATQLTLPNSQEGIVVTLFIPSEGAAKGESGCLIYYFPLPAKG
jgi:hypothetical protein